MNKKHIPIWGSCIPGNSDKSKLTVMDVHPEYTMEDIFTKYPGVWDKSCEELGDMSGNDTLVYRGEIENGFARETFTDEPFLIPYLAKGSDKCVIICPGGAYLSKSMDNEGEDIAAFLNAAGVSCFVLWYRTYPYHAPLMFLDCQRAIRFARYHAQEYGIHPQKIGIVGFSAGGNLCGVTALVFRNQRVEYPGYVPDEIDGEDAAVNALGMCYPAVSLEDDKATACIAGAEVYNDKEKRLAFSARYDMRTHVQEGDCPAFLCNTMDDDVLPPLRLAELAMTMHRKGVSCELHMFPEGGHGFGGCVDEQPLEFARDRTAVSQWKGLFANWVNRIFA